ncbi:putative phage abortive infection protein [Altererythrobacter sp.]|uniref:putative phage abortive infection protein n=1 Tax=Altererythrobacter sp. TaxID=1872480 RepID=UPI003D108236
MSSLVKWLAIISFVLAFGGMTALAYLGISDPADYKALGPWGDFFGGVANPLLTFLTFIAVLATLWLQHEELGLSREELSRSANALEAQIESGKKQRVENTFFQLMSNHNEIVNSIDLVSRGKPTTFGRDCFSVFYTRLTKIFRELEKRPNLSKSECIERAYSDFWRDHQLELGHYYRFLYRFVLFADREFADDDFYMGLLRAQLSDQELLMLFYNAQTPDGHAFKPLIEKWALLDNMPRIRLLDHEHEQLLCPPAYDSKLARQYRLEIADTSAAIDKSA